MKDDGYRLSFSIKEKGFYITDNLSGKTIIYDNNKMVTSNIDVEIVINHLKNIQEALMSYLVRTSGFFNKISGPIAEEGKTFITEEEHFKWAVSHSQKKGRLENNVFIYERGFNKTEILRAVNYVYATLAGSPVMLNPKRDIVRRIADAGLLVWVYKNNSVAVCERNVNGRTMSHCLINGKYFPIVLVSSSIELKTATLFTPELEELLTFPLDNSILTYYPPDEDIFEMTGGDTDAG